MFAIQSRSGACTLRPPLLFLACVLATWLLAASVPLAPARGRPQGVMQVDGPVKVGMLRLPLAADASDSERLRSSAGHASDKLYVLLEGDWGALSRPEAQRRLLFVYDELGSAAPGLDVCVILPGPRAWLAAHATEAEAILACDEEQPAVDQMLKVRIEDGLQDLPVHRITAPCPNSLCALGWGDDTCENLPAGWRSLQVERARQRKRELQGGGTILILLP